MTLNDFKRPLGIVIILLCAAPHAWEIRPLAHLVYHALDVLTATFWGAQLARRDWKL